MPRRCSICDNPERAEIDAAAVLTPAGRRALAKRFGVSDSALYRHAKSHLPSKLMAAKEAQDINDADQLVRQVKALQTSTLRLLKKAEDAENGPLQLGAIREARSNVELLAKLAGRLRETSVNLHLHPEWLRFREVLLTTLQKHPAAMQEVAEKLAALEGGK